MRSVAVILLLLLCLMSSETFAESSSVMLVIKPVAEDFFDFAQDGHDQERTGDDDERIVIGTINAPDFSVQEINNVALFDANGSQISLTIETSSLYSEFDDGIYNSMRILFRIRESMLQKGALRLTWGTDIAAKNQQVEQLPIYLEEKERYRTFSWEAQPSGDDRGSYAATLEVIVDDYADTYYLWYLFPMALMFILLFVKLRFLLTYPFFLQVLGIPAYHLHQCEVVGGGSNLS